MTSLKRGIYLLLPCLLFGATPARSSTHEELLSKIQNGSYELIDLSQPLKEGIPFFPGGTPFQLFKITDFNNATYASNRFSMGEHTGTHMDAPFHLSERGRTVDQIPLTDFIVPAVVIDALEKVEGNPDYALSRRELLEWEKRYRTVPKDAVVLLLTGWSRYWEDPARYRNLDAEGIPHFPGFSSEVTRFLANRRKVKGLGIDALSVDPGKSTQLQAHRISHARGQYHLENLNQLEKLPPIGALLFVFPLRIEGGTGAPVRAWALVPKETVRST